MEQRQERTRPVGRLKDGRRRRRQEDEPRGALGRSSRPPLAHLTTSMLRLMTKEVGTLFNSQTASSCFILGKSTPLLFASALHIPLSRPSFRAQTVATARCSNKWAVLGRDLMMIER